MQVRIRQTGAVMYEAEFRAYIKANDGPAWGVTTEEILDSLGADVVFEGPQATGGTVYQYSQADGVEQIDGKWYTKMCLALCLQIPRISRLLNRKLLTNLPRTLNRLSLYVQAVARRSKTAIGHSWLTLQWTKLHGLLTAKPCVMSHSSQGSLGQSLGLKCLN